MNFTLWIIIVIATCVVWLAVNQTAFHDLLSPFNLLLPAWIFPLLLRLLHLSRAERPWELKTLLLVGWATLAMAAISLGASRALPRDKSLRGRNVFQRVIVLLNQPGFSSYLVVCFLLGAAGLIYNEFVTNPIGIPMLTYLANPDIPREPNWQWTGEALWPLSIPAFTLTPLLYLKSKIVRGWMAKLAFLGLALFYPLVEIVKMSRSECIYGLTGLALVEYYYRVGTMPPAGKRRLNLKGKLRTVSLIVVVGLLALTSATLFQGIRSNRAMSTFATSLGMSVDLPEPYVSTVVEVYAYFALPQENFSNFLNNFPSSLNFGVGGLRPIYSALGQGSKVRAKLDEINFDKYLEILPVNTYPFLVSLYAESGWVGVVVFPALYAIFINYLYLRFRARSGVEMTVTYIVFFSYCWVWLFSNQNFTGIQYFLYAGAIYPIVFVFRVLAKRLKSRPKVTHPPGNILLDPKSST